MSKPIKAIPAQLFSPRNSAGKVGCCVVVVAKEQFGKVASLKPDISGRNTLQFATPDQPTQPFEH
jgi:hypothetical protein